MLLSSLLLIRCGWVSCPWCTVHTGRSCGGCSCIPSVGSLGSKRQRASCIVDRDCLMTWWLRSASQSAVEVVENSWSEDHGQVFQCHLVVLHMVVNPICGEREQSQPDVLICCTSSGISDEQYKRVVYLRRCWIKNCRVSMLQSARRLSRPFSSPSLAPVSGLPTHFINSSEY